MRIVIGVTMLSIALAGCAGHEPVQLNAARKAAIHDCSVKAAKYVFSTWQSTQFATYGTCMANHDQHWP